MYYIEQNEKIVLFDADLNELKNTIAFIPQYSGVEIKETNEEIIEYNGVFVFKKDVLDELLRNAKEAKKLEASNKAYEYIENGAMFEFEEGKHIEANDGNISKLGLAAIELILNQDTESTIEWCTVEDEVINLNAEQLQVIVQGLKAEQSRVWVELYPEFLNKIEQVQTLDEVNAIVIDYNKLSLEKRQKGE